MTDTPPLSPPVETYVDPEGRLFDYVHLVNEGSEGLVVHFSAFFGKWGDAKPYRDRFRGYFHRLKMLGDDPSHDWLFLCDAYGAMENGTYYTGQKGDLFVERAMLAILGEVQARGGYRSSQTVTIGSSMGATAALKFGLLLGVNGIVAISPHIDLDTCAVHQNRLAEVEFIIPSGGVADEDNYPYTRQVRQLVDAWDPARRLPRLFMQSCLDDAGVHEEQVMPLAAAWRAKGGEVIEDYRPWGGHTSDWATKPLMLDAIQRMLAGQEINARRYQTESVFAGSVTRPPVSHRLRQAASLTRKRLRGY